MKRIVLFITLVFFFQSIDISAQIVNGKFLNDTLKIGYPVKYSLSIKYPSDWQIFFPDSTHSYGNFEFYSKTPFKTHTTDSISLDSVVYELMSFELDSIQNIQLPVFRLYRGDTLEYLSNNDSIFLKEYIETLPQELDLKENAEHRFIPGIFNTRLLLITIAVILAILILTAVLFGKKIIAKWKIWKMNRRHKKFLEEFDAYISQNRESPDKKSIERSIGVWKDYLTELEKRPYNTYSTKEFISIIDNEDLLKSLKSLDASIYGGFSDEKIVDHLISLKHFGDDRYEFIKKEVENA